MQINWTLVTYLVIGLFALAGFFRGWWKEGITTILLVVLVFLLQQQGIAEAFINIVNTVIKAIWNIAPSVFSYIFNLFGIQTVGNAAIQADPADVDTWLLILVFAIVAAILVSRFLVGGRGAVTPLGSVLGGLVGALNGFIVINLVREYLDGRALPGQVRAPATEIALAGSSGTVGVASPGLTVQAVDLPQFTILDSLLPWVIIGLGILILIAVIRTGFNFRGAAVTRRPPPGYR